MRWGRRERGEVRGGEEIGVCMGECVCVWGVRRGLGERVERRGWGDGPVKRNS